MEYTHVKFLVPEGEHFDESAVNNEGVWLSVKHFNNIENHLAAMAKDSQQSTEALNEANNTVASLQQQVNDANATSTSLQTQLDTANARIKELEEENKTLGGQSSGNGTVIITTTDENKNEGGAKKVSLNDPNHPVVQLVSQRVAAAKNKN